MNGAKVVGIHGGRSGGREAKPLPNPLIKLRELTKQHVHSLLRKLFDGADDALFAMADKAGTNNEQTVYFDAMRELRLQKKHIATSVVKSLIRSFNEVGSYRARYISEQSNQVSEELSLIQNEDLEVRVAVEGMISRLRGVSGKSLEELKLRVEHLLQSEPLELDQVPASPEVLCDGFMDGCEGLDIDIRAQLVILKLFERFVLADMVKAYDDSNALMVQLGVMPVMRKASAPQTRPSAPSAGAPVPGAPANPVHHVAPGSAQTPMSHYAQETGGGMVGGQLEDLRNLLHGGQLQGGAVTGAEPPTLSSVYYSQNDLIGALSAFQGEQLESLGNFGPSQLIDFRSLLSQKLAQGSCDADYSEMDSDVINLVSMLFEFILDDRQLQPTMKALIARMQIPILKVALMDRNFFNKGGHPARKLLNLIASAAIGWNEPEEGKKDRLREKIESLVERVLTEFTQDLGFFNELLEDFSSFVDVEQRRGQLVEQRTKDSEKGKVASELAKKAAQENLNESIKGRVVPDSVMQLLKEGWSSVLVLHYLKEGEHGKNWLSACALVDELVWSLNPEPAEQGTRNKLLAMIPQLMKRLREGLKEVSFDEFKTKELLKSLENYHVEALQGLQAKIEAKEIGPAEVPLERMDTLSKRQRELEEQDDAIADLVRSTMELEMDFKALKSKSEPETSIDAESAQKTSDTDVKQPVSADRVGLDQDSVSEAPVHEEIVLVSTEPEAQEAVIDESDPFIKQVEKFAVGCWFEFQGSDHTERCKLAAIIKATGKYIFVNRAGIKVAEKTKMGLAVELRRGTVQILNDGLLFDRALESIITNLRGKNTGN